MYQGSYEILKKHSYNEQNENNLLSSVQDI
jgi:hypothetical protein